ncbi:MAG: ATP-binding cassette domain-containing protein [Alphaproteobacteria bacterium]|nr:ATP-binding cassette domain-containing protein [Alphaproteobacteria bacterium]
MSDARPILEIKDLSVARDGRAEIDRFSLTLNAGETVILLGEAGSGKDAVLRLLDGLVDRADEVAGTLRVGESEARPVAPRMRVPLRVAYLPGAAQRPLDPLVGAASQLARVIARRLSCPKGAAREELRGALARFVGAPSVEILDAPAGALDTVTVAWGLLAAAVASTPELVLCDHPFADMSPVAANALSKALVEEQARLGFAMLCAAREPQAVARLKARTIVLRQGRVVEEGEAAHLMATETHAYTQSLFRALPRPVAKPSRTVRGEPLLQVQGLVLSPEPRKTPRQRDMMGFELRRGASLALLGETGSGRHTLLRAVLGLERRPGRILFDAVDLNLLSEAMTLRLRRRVAFVTSNDAALDPRMTIWDTVDEPLRAHLKLSRELTAGYRDTALKRVGLASYEGRRTVATLPPFDKRRLQVARAIVAAPLMVVIDEPLRGLDAVAQTTMRDLLAEFRVESQAAFVVITSDFAVAEALCDEVMVFDKGRMVERGAVTSLAQAPKDAVTKALVEAACLV